MLFLFAEIQSFFCGIKQKAMLFLLMEESDSFKLSMLENLPELFLETNIEKW